MIEGLECRRLFALFGLEGGVLNISGTAASDAISVWLDEKAGELIVDVNGLRERIGATSVKRIVIRSFAGRDVLEIDSDLTISARFRPGSGADTCLGGGGNDYLFGGPGDDVLDGRGGGDTLAGQRGHDLLLAIDHEIDHLASVSFRDDAQTDDDDLIEALQH